MGISLNGLTPAGTYPGLIKTGDNTAISGTPKVLSDGNGNNLPMEVSTTGVNLTGSPTVNSVAIANTTQVAAKQDTLVSGTNIKTINGTSVLGSGNIVTPTTNPSGLSGAIQFSDGSAFASDAANLFWDDTNNRLGVGTNAPSATAHFKGSGSTSATTSLLVQNSSGNTALQVFNDRSFVVGNFGANGAGLGILAGNPTGAGVGGGINFNFNNGAAFNDDTNNSALKMTYNGGVRIPNSSRYPLTLGSDTKAVASAQLEMVSTTQGFLPPRMTTTQKNAIASPASGLILYDSTTNKLQCYNGSTWNDLF